MNKYKLLIIICFFLVTLCLPKVTATVKNLNLLGKVIILDAGHGGKDEGASSGSIKESKLNLILTKKLEKEEVIDILKNNYEEMNEVFSSIDECIGSASIAQVHLATLTNGKKVVVKVCRPNVYEQMELDVQLSKKVVRLLHLNHLIKAVDLSSMLDEMLAVSKEESNLLIELDHLVKFRELNSQEEGIDVPFVYQEFCTKQVLVMEYIKGIKIISTRIKCVNNCHITII